MRQLNTSTRHHHSFVSNFEPDVHLIFTPANTTRISHGFRICQKSTGKAQTEAWRLLVLPFTRKRWIKNVEMRQKTVQSHCNNVRRQRFPNKRALARTRYEAFGATEGFGKDERESREFQRAAKKIMPVNAKVERHRQRLQQLLNLYQNNNLLSVLERLSFNFDFWMYLFLA